MLRKQSILIIALLSLLIVAVSCSKKEQGQADKEAQKSQPAVQKEAETQKAPGAIGSKAADFNLVDLEGNEVTLDTWEDKVILLNFWATWCPPCRVEIPDFIEMYDKYKDQGLVILGLSGFREDLSKIKPFAEENNMNYPILFVEQDKIQSLVTNYGGVEGIPTTFLIDPDGIIRHKWVGPITEDDFLEQGKQYLD